MGRKIFNLWDQRLQGSGEPQGADGLFKCDVSTPLSQATRWLADKGRANNSDYVLARILCHGIEPITPEVGAGDDEGGWNFVSQGGGGLQFCSEGIGLETLKFFRTVRDWIDRIDILGCGAAYITPGSEGKWGDGNLLCSQLAQITQAQVRASTATQTYAINNIAFGQWEGTVLTYGPKGNVINVENNPVDNF